MKALFGKKWLWVILALVFFSLVIWYGGPYVAVADYQPLGSELARIIGIVLIVVLWGLRALLSEWKAARATALTSSLLARAGFHSLSRARSPHRTTISTMPMIRASSEPRGW